MRSLRLEAGDRHVGKARHGDHAVVVGDHDRIVAVGRVEDDRVRRRRRHPRSILTSLTSVWLRSFHDRDGVGAAHGLNSIVSTLSRSIVTLAISRKRAGRAAIGRDVDVLGDVGAVEQSVSKPAWPVDRVVVVARVPDERVVAGAHQRDVVAIAAVDEVIAFAAGDRVVAQTAVDRELDSTGLRPEALMTSLPPLPVASAGRWPSWELAIVTLAEAVDGDAAAGDAVMVSLPWVPLTVTVSAAPSPCRCPPAPTGRGRPA